MDSSCSRRTDLYCCADCLVCILISCPRTPTEPICNPLLLSSSTAASCVVTALCFILSPAVTLRSPGISVSCSFVSSIHHQHQPLSSLHVSTGHEHSSTRENSYKWLKSRGVSGWSTDVLDKWGSSKLTNTLHTHTCTVFSLWYYLVW